MPTQYLPDLPGGAPNSKIINSPAEWQDWHTWLVSYQNIEDWTGIKFSFPTAISSELLADSEGNTISTINSLVRNTAIDRIHLLDPLPVFRNLSLDLQIGPIGRPISSKNSIVIDTVDETDSPVNNERSLRASKVSSSKVNIFKDSSATFSTIENYSPHISTTEISTNETGITEVNPTQNSISKVTNVNIATGEVNMTEVGSSEATTIQRVVLPRHGFGGPVNLGQQLFIPNTTQIQPTEIQSTEVSLPSFVPSQQLFSGNLSHDNTSLLTSIYSTAQSIWHSNTNLTFNITNLPTGQLAEATITGYDTNGRPNTATISIDDDANGVGWFLDTTPQDNSEFTGTDTYFQASPNSPASGKYDLLTAILHEMGHTLGFINGYSQFNQNIKGRQFYTDSTHSYTLSSDLSHLDNTLYPNDLLNTNLKPGIRKLPSTMDWAIINAISGNTGVGALASNGVTNPAHLTAGALIGITNGDFTTPTTINEGQTIQLSALAKDGGTSDNLTYTWNLGDGSNPITGNNIAHTYTDNGNYEVTLTVTDKDGGSTQQTTTVKVDNLAPIVNLTTPTTTTSTGSGQALNQGETLNLGVTYSDPGIKDTHTITWNFGDGTTPITGVTNPNHTFIKAGTNNVTVTVTDNDGASTTKSLQIAVANLPPTINTLDIPTNINEGSTVQLTATATDPGNDSLIYNWYINGATTPIIGQTIDYQFTDNGVYPVRLNVIDSNGAIATKSVDVTINNVAPVIISIIQPNQINEGQPVQFTATATDSGINDTLTYSWNLTTLPRLAVKHSQRTRTIVR
jgi:PKD repeat protein